MPTAAGADAAWSIFFFVMPAVLRTKKRGPEDPRVKVDRSSFAWGYARIRAACVTTAIATGANRTKASAKESVLVIGCPFVNWCVVSAFD